MSQKLKGVLLCVAVGIASSLWPQEPNNGGDRLLLENDLARVSKLTVTPASRSIKSDHDTIVVLPLDGSITARIGVQDEPQSPGAIFVPRTEPISLAGNSANVILVELMKHWDVPMKNCAPPAPCARSIRMGDAVIGETRTLFSNGFVSGFLHQLDAGGILNSSYYSQKGDDSILLIPYTRVRVVLDGQEFDLDALHPYFAKIKEAEVTGGDKRANWVVIRLNQPRETAK